MDACKSHWIGRDVLDCKRNEISQNIYSWLVMPKNLTDTIKKTDVRFSLDVISESFSEPYRDEKNAFYGYPSDVSSSFVRKVFLKGDDKAMVFARVIIPEDTYINYKNEFLSLGSRAIGNALLHHDKKVVRGDFEYKLLRSGDELLSEIKELNCTSEKGDLWARRSVFSLPKGYLLITEVFLSAIPVYPV
jgi:chorismate-pyruvate lyase